MKKLATALLLALLLANPSDLSSCVHTTPTAIFSRSLGPDSERAFFAGKLGILKPTYERRYLAMAYRMLNDMPLTPAQQSAVLNLERFRDNQKEQDRVKAWLAARARVKSAKSIKDLDFYRRAQDYSYILSCPADAFDTARKTLLQRIKQAGAASPEVTEWLQAQDLVFGLCSNGGGIPAPAPKGSSERIMADRAYQIAAAKFYFGLFDEARAKWKEIAADPASPWKIWAPYLIARAYLREQKYPEAAVQLKTVIAQKSEAPLHRQARALLDYANAQTDPARQLIVLSNRLMQPNPESLGHTLNDFTFIYDKLENSDAARKVLRRSDLSDWICEFQDKDLSHTALKRWRDTDSLAWLLVAANSVKPNTQDRRDVLDALIAVPASSPGYASARAAAAQLLIDQKDAPQAFTVLNEALTQPDSSSFDVSTLNTFRSLRMKVTPTVDQFLADAPRQLPFVAEEGLNYNSKSIFKYEGGFPIRPPQPELNEPTQNFDYDATLVFDKVLPLSVWSKAVVAPSIPANLRTYLAQTGLIRAVILGLPSDDFITQLSSLKHSYRRSLSSFSALPERAQRFAVVFWVLHHPELGPYLVGGLPRNELDGAIDNYRANWWCAGSYQEGNAPVPSFLSPEERKEGESQFAKLKAAGDGPTFLTSTVLTWVRSHPRDPRNAEALALAVKSWRFGCQIQIKDHSLGRQAYTLLHERYPDSKWAKATPLYF